MAKGFRFRAPLVGENIGSEYVFLYMKFIILMFR